MGNRRFTKTIFIFILYFMCFKNNIAIAAQGDSINITIPSKLDIKLNSDGSNTLSNFTVQNQSLVPITINNINLIKNADWNIVPSNVSIPKDTKQISLSVEGKELALGDNTHSIIVPYGDNRVPNISLKEVYGQKIHLLLTFFH